MYRVREPYKQAIDRISERFPHVRAIDQAAFVSDRDFVDHCHPLSAAQERMADKILAENTLDAMSGSDALAIENWLYNPEYAEGNETDFHAYFRSSSALSPQEIGGQVERLRRAVDSEDWKAVFAAAPTEIRNALDYALTHPALPTYRHALRLGPAYATDAGRFPEFFTIRALLPFLREAQSMPALQALLGMEAFPLRQSGDLIKVLPEYARGWVADHVPRLDVTEAREWRDAILTRAVKDIETHLAKGNQVHHRLKSTIFWYFRETLRFGPHSRISMRYERVALEMIAEALAVAAYLDFKLDGKRRSDIENQIAALSDVVAIHEKYCSIYAPEDDASDVLSEYDERLEALLKKLKAKV